MSVLNVATPIGQICSFALTGYTFSQINGDLPKVELDDIVINSTNNLIVLQNVPYVLFFIFFQVVIRDKPETLPSAVASAPIDEMSFLESFKKMWANKNFMILSLTYALQYGVYCGIGTTMSNILNPFGFSPI